MDDIVLVQVLQTEDDAADEELDDVFGELFVTADLKPEISARHIVHDEIQVEPVLESEDHVDDEGVFEFREEFAFVEDGLDALLGDDSE